MQLIQNYWLAAEIEDSTVSRCIAIYFGIGFILVLFLLQRAFSVVGLGFGASLSNFSTLLSSIIRALMYFYDATTPLWRILGQVRVSKAIVVMSSIFIQDIMTWTKLTRCQKVRDQINTIKRLKTKLKYGVKNRDQISSLPFFFFLISLLLWYLLIWVLWSSIVFRWWRFLSPVQQKGAIIWKLRKQDNSVSHYAMCDIQVICLPLNFLLLKMWWIYGNKN